MGRSSSLSFGRGLGRGLTAIFQPQLAAGFSPQSIQDFPGNINSGGRIDRVARLDNGLKPDEIIPGAY
jgi:hypothetical protein